MNRSCPYPDCGLSFTSLADYGVHTETHRANGERLKRPTSCWSCATDIAFGLDKCPQCGADHPCKRADVRAFAWANGYTLDEAVEHMRRRDGQTLNVGDRVIVTPLGGGSRFGIIIDSIRVGGLGTIIDGYMFRMRDGVRGTSRKMIRVESQAAIEVVTAGSEVVDTNT